MTRSKAKAAPESPQRFEKLLSVGEVAAILGVGMSSTKLLIHRGELRSLKVGGRRLVHPDDLAAYIERQRAAGE